MLEIHNMTAIPLLILLAVRCTPAHDRQHGGRVERALYPLIVGKCTALHRTQLGESYSWICCC